MNTAVFGGPHSDKNQLTSEPLSAKLKVPVNRLSRSHGPVKGAPPLAKVSNCRVRFFTCMASFSARSNLLSFSAGSLAIRARPILPTIPVLIWITLYRNRFVKQDGPMPPTRTSPTADGNMPVRAIAVSTVHLTIDKLMRLVALPRGQTPCSPFPHALIHQANHLTSFAQSTLMTTPHGFGT